MKICIFTTPPSYWHKCSSEIFMGNIYPSFPTPVGPKWQWPRVSIIFLEFAFGNFRICHMNHTAFVHWPLPFLLSVFYIFVVSGWKSASIPQSLWCLFYHVYNNNDLSCNMDCSKSIYIFLSCKPLLLTVTAPICIWNIRLTLAHTWEIFSKSITQTTKHSFISFL